MIARYAARLNGLTEFFLTKLDVLGAWERIPVCVAYEIDGVRHEEMPMTQSEFHHATPVYEFFDGWEEDISGCRTFEDLPKNAQVYVRALEEMSGTPFWGVGVGPGREQSIVLDGRLVNVLVIGGGGREHALACALARDPGVEQVHAAPGNPGIAEVAELHPVDPVDGDAVAGLAERLGVDLVVIGPEAPLVAGVADAVRARGISCFGPSAEAARLEGSKAFAKEVMAAAGVPTAMARVCSTPRRPPTRSTRSARRTSSRTTGSPPARAWWSPRTARRRSPTRRRASGWSSRSTSTGRRCRCSRSPTARPSYPCCRRRTSSARSTATRGPNTGGMGAYTPLTWLPEGLVAEVTERVLQPTVDEMARRGTPFIGLLYAGLALTRRGVRVVEFNARFGDPETQPLLALLDSPLGALLPPRRTGRLDELGPLTWRDGAAVAVVVAAADYPGTPRTGDVIDGLRRGGRPRRRRR